MRKLTVGCSLGLAILLSATTAFAGGGNTSSVACGASPASWNAPNGALVISRASGVVKGVIDNIGEWGTHSMLSHGPITAAGTYGRPWVTHNTMFTPGTNDVCKACDEPIRAGELGNGYPGANQTNQGGIYEYLHGDGGLEGIIYKAGGTDGQKIADCTWSNFPFTWVASQQNSSYGIYRLKHPQSGGFIPYWVYHYKDGNAGGDDNGYWYGSTWQTGQVCSTFLAYLQAHYTGTAVNSRSYSGSLACSAMYGLANNVQAECDRGFGFWAGLGAGLACTFCDFDTNVCDDAGRQTARCFATNNCDNGHDNLNSGMCNSGATSLSPDQLSGRLWDYSSKWSTSGSADVYWNQPGSTYGCWF